MSDKKPREFWVGIQPQESAVGCCYHKPAGGTVHVIEYSAYEALEKDRNNCYQLWDENRVRLVEVIQLKAEITRLEAEALEYKKKDRDEKWPKIMAEYKALEAERDKFHGDYLLIKDAYDHAYKSAEELIKERDELKSQLAWSLKNEEQYKKETGDALREVGALKAELELSTQKLLAEYKNAQQKHDDASRFYSDREELRAHAAKLERRNEEISVHATRLAALIYCPEPVAQPKKGYPTFYAPCGKCVNCEALAEHEKFKC